MNSVLNVLAALVLCLPLLALAVVERRAKRQAARRLADEHAWINDRIRTRPDQRATWRLVKKYAKEEVEL
ncbi:hypothetical protein [Streptomyces mutabilis]|uniref:hypothetical protein n=1 Tax=Streptomyces mutabilis TaxID=67332 RepID=UPI003693AC97